ncbi:MAG: tyrosine-type recombinase/integrase [Haliscomenobacter sp.]|nr:tyrosine-type recombinase/integrase [Haliscomenobacter sp.]
MNWQPLRNGFRAHLLLERGLSEHTIEAYLRDIGKLEDYARISGLECGPEALSPHSLQQFFRFLNELGLGARSQARLLSAVKTFYKYLVMENLVAANPTDLLEGPRLLRGIPTVLSFSEVQRMIQSIDLSTDHGLRDRAILETLYASGLRVSELCDLRLSHLYLDVGFIKVTGKGDKERLVPIGEEAIKHIRIYRQHVRDKLPVIHAGHENILFLNRRETPEPHHRVQHGARRGASGRHPQNRQPPHAAAFLCHPPHRRRGRFKSGSGYAGARIHPYHGDLYAPRQCLSPGNPPALPSSEPAGCA